MNKILYPVLAVLILISASIVMAWQPSGWVYHNGDYAYASGEGGWYFFRPSDDQWRVNLNTGIWGTLDDASGWIYYKWPYAYSSQAASWYWHKPGDEQWCCQLSSGAWSLLGVPSLPGGMVLVPGGTNSGTNPLGEGESYTPDIYPESYSLTVEAFYMDKHEVSKALWDEVYSWAVANGYSFSSAGLGKAADHPVHTVNWYDAIKWCNARSAKEGRSAVYMVNGAVYKTGQADDVVQTSAAGYRLPTDTEWEYAARGGLGGERFPWGASINHSHANYKANGSDCSCDTSPYTSSTYHPDYDDGGQPYTSPVGSFAPNGYGLYDMAGNVREWCFDWHPAYVNTYRVHRGGGWMGNAFGCRVANRGYAYQGYAGKIIGLRTVLPPSPAGAQ